MEMSYQRLDPMLSSVGAGQNSQSSEKTAQNTDRSEFDSMVRKKQQEVRGQGEGKKTPAAGTPEKAPQEPVADERYAIAVAMLYQAQPDLRAIDFTNDAVVTGPAVEVPGLETLPVLQAFADTDSANDQQAVDLMGEVLPEEQAVIEEVPVAVDNVRPEIMQVEETVVQNEAPVIAERVDERVAADEETVTVEDQSVDVPVFGYMEAAPVQVAAPAEKPVPLEAEDGIAQLGEHLERAIVYESSETHVEVALYPANLGKVLVEITHDDDGILHIALTATTLRAATILERNAGGLQNILAAPTRPEVQVEVRGTQESSQQFLNPNGQDQQGQQQNRQNQQNQEQHHRSNDFLQQLRLGLVDVDGEA